jgi:hypothetical protein
MRSEEIAIAADAGLEVKWCDKLYFKTSEPITLQAAHSLSLCIYI